MSHSGGFPYGAQYRDRKADESDRSIWGSS